MRIFLFLRRWRNKERDGCEERLSKETTFPSVSAEEQISDIEASVVRRLKKLEEENIFLKKMYAEVSMENQILKEEQFTKKGWALPHKGC